MNKLVATVAVERTQFNKARDYDYYVPADMEKTVLVGSVVEVPFGRGNRTRQGVVIKLFSAINSDLKNIKSVNPNVTLSTEMVELALWLKERCFCTTYDALRPMLPYGIGKIGDKSNKMIRLVAYDDLENMRLTDKQNTVCSLLFDIGTASVSEVCEFCSVTKVVLDNLVKYGICEYYEREVYRLPFENVSENGVKDEIKLSPEQQKAFDTYEKMMLSGGGSGLLYGVTGSGKTCVYLRLVDRALQEGKNAIVLVPEISLTPQMLAIFQKRYGKKVAIVHSRLSMGERFDEYKRIDRGEAKIVLGTRSAIFSPVKNLGLIVMDEEQEHSYVSEKTPRYSTKDVARFRARYNGALFLMTSATPSVETYSAALKGRHVLCELNERYGPATLPQVITVDMKAEIKAGNESPISGTLRMLIDDNLARGKQTILLINRRGYNTFIACANCGAVMTCPNCSISLTYHSYSNRLMCHVCGHSRSLDYTCPACGERSLAYSGYGSQRIQSEIEFLFPTARILRMDADTTVSKHSYQKNFEAFQNGEYDIMIGTQMVAKGLDFPNVTLVGVVNADNSLYNESYMANETAFDLITQVVGRSGRRGERGRAVIQTINPQNETVRFAAEQNYKAFYESEMKIRKVLTYPPYCDIYSVLFSSADELAVETCATEFLNKIISLNANEYRNEKIIVLGPSQAKIYKANNVFRRRILIKCKNSKGMRKMLTDAVTAINAKKENKNVLVSVDLNPYNID